MGRKKTKRNSKTKQHNVVKETPPSDEVLKKERSEDVVLDVALNEPAPTKVPLIKEPKVTRCPHVSVCQKLTLLNIVKAKQDERCAECSVRDGQRWLCLSDSCGSLLCGSRTNNHSDTHFKKNEGHYLVMNMRSGRIWCQSCSCEVNPDTNIPPFTPAVEKVLRNKELLKSKNDGALAVAAGVAVNSAGDSKELAEKSHEPALSVPNPPSFEFVPKRGRLFNEHGETRSLFMKDVEDEDDLTFPRGLTGLNNLGNTCYLNAAVQALSNCAPLSDLFRSANSMAPFASQCAATSSRIAEPLLSRSFRLLLQSVWSSTRKRSVSPHLFLTQVRAHCPQFRGWAQQDSQEFIRCFLNLIHRELRQPVFPWELRVCGESVSGVRLSTCSSGSSPCLAPSHVPPRASPSPSVLPDTVSASRRNSSTSSACSSSAADRYETADSGWSSDGEVNGKGACRKRMHSEWSQPVEDLSTNQSTAPLRSTHSSPTFAKRQQLIDFNDNPESTREGMLRYRSIVSEVFDGELRSAVKCLTCQHVSETHETFQDLSLSIPTNEQLEQIVAAKEGALDPPRHTDHDQPIASGSRDMWQWPWWWGLGLLRYFYSYLFGGSVSLMDALTAFFSPDHLRGDNMYSCEKCGKLRNGVKTCRITQLPEVLCIHLKRFRHDASTYTKVSTSVTFPVCDLDLSRFFSSPEGYAAHKNTLYDLCAFVSHHGSTADSGHYLAYCRNELDGDWYEFDDSVVTRLEPADVMAKEAYVLFYQKRGTQDMAALNHTVTRLMEKEDGDRNKLKSTSHWYISREWLHRLSTFSHPGPITNHDFLCRHSQILPSRAVNLAEYYATVDSPLWDLLHSKFGGGPVCTELHYCPTCQAEYQWLRNKRNTELTAFRALEARVAAAARFYPQLTYTYYLPPNAISKLWLDRWRAFVSGEELEPPGPVDNNSLLVRNETTLHFRPSSHHAQISRELWLFFHSIYGGGPEVLCVTGVHPTEEEIAQMQDEVAPVITRILQSLRDPSQTNLPPALVSVLLPAEKQGDSVSCEYSGGEEPMSLSD